MKKNVLDTIIQKKIRDEEIKSRISDDLLMSLSEDELQKILFRWLKIHRINFGVDLECVKRKTIFTFQIYERYGNEPTFRCINYHDDVDRNSMIYE